MRSGPVALVHLAAALGTGLAGPAGLAGCSGQPRRMPLQRVVLYQNGIGFFERTGRVGGDRIQLPFSRHELDDVLKTLTVIDRGQAGVATIEVPELHDRDKHVTLGVRMAGGGAHDVAVSYAVPTPTWKAAYRIVLDDRDGAPALLQGWAKVDNASQEDWRGVRLTLATGAPMSYALDLHTATFVDRPDVTGKLVSPVVIGRVQNEKAGAGTGDKDGDKVANADDMCPDDPEDKDGFEDEDGCPDPDNDKDRIADRTDKCPNEPETYNGLEDEDGCPDRGRVIVTDTAIEILDNIYFAAGSDSVRRESMPIVDGVAATLAGNPSIKQVEVQGHAAAGERDPLGLSDRRAAAVQAALMAKGVPASRLTAQGYGATQPLDRGATERARAKNRRVAFLILKRSADEPDRPAGKPAPLPAIDPRTAQASARPQVRPVEVAGAVRYEIATPVSVARGASTLVPILGKPVTAEDAYLWRPDASAPGSDRHPFRAVRLVNTSGFTLQPGSIAIFARGTFVGDSLLDRLDLDETAWIPYALDSGTAVTSTGATAERPVRIVALHRGVLTVENAGVRTTTYRIAAGRQPARRIYLRHARAPGYSVKDLPPGTIDQGDAYLLAASLSPGKTTELVLEEREPRRRALELIDSRAGDLGVYVEGSSLPPGVGDRIKQAVDLRKQMAAVEEEITAARRKLDDVSARSHEIRESMRALEKVRTADDLRKKLIASLAAATQESDQLAKEIAAKSEVLAGVRGRLQDAIRGLQLDEPGAPTP